MPNQKMTAAQAKQAIHSIEECALLDIREHGQYGEGHPFLSVHCPYSRFEQSVAELVPRVSVQIILMDDGDNLSERAARRLEEMGYTQVSILKGGAPAWRAAGYTLFKGVNLPSKVLGELVEHSDKPQMLTPTELHDWQSSGKNFVFFDSRPPNEYAKMTIPGAACVPNGELAHRLSAVVPDDQTPIVITCAGRTRGIIGAAGLDRLGLSNPVYAIENGTQGWALSGYTLQRAPPLPAMPVLKDNDLATSRARAQDLIQREGLSVISAQDFLGLAQDPERTIYLIDVRSEDEFNQGHLPGAVHAWSGQIVQTTDQWVGVRRARVVLSDDTGMRAAVAAVWLRTLRYEVYLLQETNPNALPQNWRRYAPTLPSAPSLSALSAEQTLGMSQSGQAQLIDLRGSQVYRAGHPEGALWACRPRLSALTTALNKPVILVSDDAIDAQFAAQEMAALGLTVCGFLAGGFSAWKAAGHSLVKTPDIPAEEDCIDFLFFAHDRHDGNLESARRYLAWETGLIAQLDEEENACFSLRAQH